MMIIYWINLEIRFLDKMPIISKDKNKSYNGAKGFFQEIGCSAKDRTELKRIIVEYLHTLEWLELSKVEINYDRIGEIPTNEIQTEIYGDLDVKENLQSDPLTKGIWYLSGRAFYTDEEEDNEFSEVIPWPIKDQ